MKLVTRKMTKQVKPISRQKILRSVASSTAIETGESVEVIEARLKNGKPRFKSLKLA